MGVKCYFRFVIWTIDHILPRSRGGTNVEIKQEKVYVFCGDVKIPEGTRLPFCGIRHHIFLLTPKIKYDLLNIKEGSHIMKTILLFSIMLCAIATPALAELTDADLDKIRLIVQEEIKPLKDEIGTLKTDIVVIKTEVTNLKGTVNTNFDTTQKNFNRQNNIIIACIGIPMAILAIGATVWGVYAYKRSRKADTQQEQIKSLIEDVNTLMKQQPAHSTGTEL